jgi:S1-C subfamily serine protease
VGPLGDDGRDISSDNEGGGPPPDPSLRAWRHPSEIAAAAAAASRPPRAAPNRTVSRLVVTGAGAALVFVVVAGTLMLAIGTTVTIQASRSPNGSTLVQLSSGNPVSGRSGTAPPELRAGEAAGTSGADESSEVEPEAAVSSSAGEVPITTVSGAVTTPLMMSEEPTTTTELAAGGTGEASATVLDRSQLPPPGELGDGVFTVAGSNVTRLGLFIAVDGMLLTSASAIDSHDRVAVILDNSWTEAVVVATDPATDVAVLELSGSGAAELDGMASNAVDPVEPAAGARIEVPVAGASDGEVTTGIIIGADQRILTRTGIPVYGSLLTTARLPDRGSGAALLDRGGSPVGLVIDSIGYLASAVPIERAVAVGRSLIEQDTPTAEWLGVEGRSHPGGGAKLHAVVTASPAEQAGLEPGDVIVGIDGDDVIDWFHLIYFVRQAGSGTTVTVEVDRGATTRELPVTIGTRVQTAGRGDG